LSAPHLAGNEWRYIKECLDTNWVSSVGSFVDRFERMVADYVGAKYAIAVVNGTSALHIALLLAGVKPDDEVIVSSLTFVAPVNAIRYAGAWPVFMDADPKSWQMDPAKVVDFLSNECLWKNGALYNKLTGRRVRAVLPVHILGSVVDVDPILELAGKFDLRIIEDATEGLGARHRGRHVGKLGDIACFSFNGNKIITTGGGGMIVTDSESWARRAKYLTTQAKDDPIEYIHNEIGYNYRLTNVLAALGVAQFEQIGQFLEKKRQIADVYDKAFSGFAGVEIMPKSPWVDQTYWLYTVLLQCGTDLRTRKEVVARLNHEGIGSRPLWHPVHALAPYRDSQSYRIEHTTSIYDRGICLPCGVSLSAAEQLRSIETFQEIVSSILP
ncbi:MAG: LegC family aminotransferase, partial [Elusimicrobiota bacterium]